MADRKKNLLDRAEALKDELVAVRRDLHRNPELSFQEEETSARMADELRTAGFTVT